MNMCNYIQNVFEAYLVVTNALHYDIDYTYEDLSMYVRGRKVVHLSSENLEWRRVPIIEHPLSYIRNSEFDYIVEITTDYGVKFKIDVKYR